MSGILLWLRSWRCNYGGPRASDDKGRLKHGFKRANPDDSYARNEADAGTATPWRLGVVHWGHGPEFCGVLGASDYFCPAGESCGTMCASISHQRFAGWLEPALSHSWKWNIAHSFSWFSHEHLHFLGDVQFPRLMTPEGIQKWWVNDVAYLAKLVCKSPKTRLCGRYIYS